MLSKVPKSGKLLISLPHQCCCALFVLLGKQTYSAAHMSGGLDEACPKLLETQPAGLAELVSHHYSCS